VARLTAARWWPTGRSLDASSCCGGVVMGEYCFPSRPASGSTALRRRWSGCVALWALAAFALWPPERSETPWRCTGHQQHQIPPRKQGEKFWLLPLGYDHPFTWAVKRLRSSAPAHSFPRLPVAGTGSRQAGGERELGSLTSYLGTNSLSVA